MNVKIKGAGLQPPRPSDYSPDVIDKVVRDTGLKHPATLYPIALGAGTGFVGLLFGMPVLYVGALAGILVGTGWAASQLLFFKKHISGRYMQLLSERQKRYEAELKQVIQKELKACDTIQGAEGLARQGAAQFNKIQQKLENIQELLTLKLNTAELTFGRFQGAAEQVSLSVLDNLRSVVTILKSLGSIDVDYIRQRLASIAAQQSLSAEDDRERQTLEQRMVLREEQLKKVKSLLAKNEEAMTEMEKISAKVAEWQTGAHFASVDYESAISRLQELAEQAHIYN